MGSFFAKIGSFFKGLFTNPNTIQVAQSTIRMIGPIIVGIVSVADPASAPFVRSVVYEVMTDLGAVNGLLQHVQQTGDKSVLGRATGMVQGISDNLSGLLTAGHIKNPATVATVQTVIAELANVIQELPNAQPLATPPVAPAMPPTPGQ